MGWGRGRTGEGLLLPTLSDVFSYIFLLLTVSSSLSDVVYD